MAMSLPGRRAPASQKAIHDLIDDLQASLPTIFESEDYQKRRSAIEQSMQSNNEQAFTKLSEKATAPGQLDAELSDAIDKHAWIPVVIAS